MCIFMSIGVILRDALFFLHKPNDYMIYHNLCIIVAVDDNMGIGINNKLLCYLPHDLKRFKAITTGYPIIMGRKTFDSLPQRKPLPKRDNIILTQQDRSLFPSNTTIIHNLEEALQIINDTSDLVFIIGGSSIYRLLLPYTNTIYLTELHSTYDADSFFPCLNIHEWKEEGREDFYNDELDICYSFSTKIRV